MSGRHRRPAHRRMVTSTAGVLGVAALGVPLASGAALAAAPAASAQTSDSGAEKAQKPRAERVLDIARNQKGDPYSYGADGPGAFDCSGLTQYVYNKVGVNLPRTSGAQQNAVNQIAKSNKQRGDLIFFHDSGDVYHVGIYAGHGKIWAAPSPGESVSKSEIWTSSYTVGRP